MTTLNWVDDIVLKNNPYCYSCIDKIIENNPLGGDIGGFFQYEYNNPDGTSPAWENNPIVD